ncbi:MAG: PA2779 family protein [Terriglobales bacterium]
MHFKTKKLSQIATAFVLAAVFALPQNLVAEGAAHVVSPADLQRATVQASNLRQQNVEQVRQFFSSEKAEKALRSAHLNPEQVKNAVSTLDDAELAQLAQRTQKAQADFAAGTLSDRDLIIILVAVAVLILIIVAVR